MHSCTEELVFEITSGLDIPIEDFGTMAKAFQERFSWSLVPRFYFDNKMRGKFNLCVVRNISSVDLSTKEEVMKSLDMDFGRMLDFICGFRAGARTRAE